MSRHKGGRGRTWECGGKVRYRDGAEAKRALTSVRSLSLRGKQPVRAYDCDRCQGWHLTSQPLEAQGPDLLAETGAQARGSEPPKEPADDSPQRARAQGCQGEGQGDGIVDVLHGAPSGEVRTARARRYWPGEPVTRV